jgi:Glycosyl transferases group 1
MNCAVDAVRVLATVPADFDALRETEAADHDGLDVIDRETFSRWGLLQRLVRSAERYHAVLLNGSGRLDQIGAVLLAQKRSEVPIVIADSTWRRGTWWLDRLVCRAGLRALDTPAVTYCVLSTAELELFPRTWGVDPERVAFTPFCYTLTEAELAQPISQGGGVFAGGDSMRDYRPLLVAASRLGAEVTLAVRRPPRAWGRQVGSNVHLGPVSQARFFELMRQADAIVVPMLEGGERSAGQQTYLNAMAMGKVVIVTDTPGARDYIEDGVTGLIVPPGDADALVRAIATVLDPARAPEAKEMASRARAVARTRFRPIDHLGSMLEVVHAAVRRRAS